jgi:hypothetical protein
MEKMGSHAPVYRRSFEQMLSGGFLHTQLLVGRHFP